MKRTIIGLAVAAITTAGWWHGWPGYRHDAVCRIESQHVGAALGTKVTETHVRCGKRTFTVWNTESTPLPADPPVTQ